MKTVSQVLIALCLCAAAACSKASSPLTPSATPASPSSPTTTSVINGSVTGTASARTTVVVAGTSISADVDGANRFQLRDVPAGSVNLEFRGGTTTAVLGGLDVQPARTLEIAVTVSGATATLDTRSSASEGEAEIEGRLESIGASTLVVAGRTITTTSATTYVKNGAPAARGDLATGVRAEVKGTTTGGTITASLVKWEVEASAPTAPGAPGTTDDSPEVTGIVKGMSGTPAAFQFTVNGQVVTGDATTVFLRSVFTDLKNDVTVEVRGTKQAGVLRAASIHVEDVNDDNGAGAGVEAEFTGVLTSKSGAAPVLTLVVGGRTVTTTAATVVRRKGIDVGFGALVVNGTIEVEGLVKGSSVEARKISIEDSSDDDATTEVELKGIASGVSGSCPALTFTVGGQTFETSASTEFRLACGSVKANVALEVRGMRLSTGRIAATRVSKGD